VKSRSRHLDVSRPYTANLCRFLRSARNDVRRLPTALLSHTGGPNARAPGWAALVALGGHSRTEVRQFRSKKEYCRVADRQNPHHQHWPVILRKPRIVRGPEPRPAVELPILRNIASRMPDGSLALSDRLRWTKPGIGDFTERAFTRSDPAWDFSACMAGCRFPVPNPFRLPRTVSECPAVGLICELETTWPNGLSAHYPRNKSAPRGHCRSPCTAVRQTWSCPVLRGRFWICGLPSVPAGGPSLTQRGFAKTAASS
jgi:hypothetical protein